MPDLNFAIVDADVVPFAASPTLLFKLRIGNAIEDEQIQSILLRAQIRIQATRRQYEVDEVIRLQELFGAPHRWGETLRSLLWTHSTAVIPSFVGSTLAELPIACTYDFEMTAAKYFGALTNGEVPLTFLLSGTVFYSHGESGLQIAQIPWDKEVLFRMPVSVWTSMMNRYFPNSAWLRVRKDVFDHLYRYRIEKGLQTWEDALETLLSH